MASIDEIFDLVQQGKMTAAEAKEKAKAVKAKGEKEVTYKVAPKGGISFYGLRRMPITLYSEELEKIIKTTQTAEFKKFLIDNVENLSTKEK